MNKKSQVELMKVYIKDTQEQLVKNPDDPFLVGRCSALETVAINLFKMKTSGIWNTIDK